MPRARKTKKAMPRKRMVARKRVQRRRLPPLISNLTIKPRLVRLRYSDKITIAASTGATGFYTFRANSIFDCDYTSTGHQPFMHDQLAAMYSNYMVIGSKISVKHHGYGTSGNPYYRGVYLSDDYLVPSDANLIVEKGKGKWTLDGTGSEHADTLTCSFGAKKFFAVTNLKDNSSTLGALFGSNPTKPAYFNIWLQTVNKTDTSVDNFVVTIDYLVLCSGLNSTTSGS